MGEIALSLFRRLIRLVSGLFCFSIGILFCVQGQLGYAPWDILNDGVSKLCAISFGSASILIGVVLLLVLLAFRKPVGLGTVLNMVLIGLFYDILFSTGLVPSQTSFWPGLLFLGIGTLIIAVATFLYVGAGLGAGPRDGLMLLILEKTGWPVGLCRALIDVATTITGFCMGGFLGIGTIVCVFATGPAIQLVFMLFRFDPGALQHQSLWATFGKLLKRGA